MLITTEAKIVDKNLTHTLSQIMRTLRKKKLPDPKVKPYPGYFYLPYSVQGSPYNLPLGFLGTTGCSWVKRGGCTMCDYSGFANNPSDEEFISQAEYLLQCWEQKGPLKEINLSALGSFFDEAELSPRARQGVLERVASRKSIDLLGVESRPEFITHDKIKEAKRILGPRLRFEVGMGLESSNEFIRNVCINKGLTERSYLKAVDCLKELDAKVVTHVLFKPPFLTEAEAIKDTIQTISYAERKGADRIVLMVANVKEYTLTSWLRERGLYRVPWLWSVLKVALESSEKAQKKLLIYGFKCGISLRDKGRNCPLCTDVVLNKIELFNFTGNVKYLEEGFHQDCECKDKWMEELSYAAGFASLPIPQRVEKVCKLFNDELSKD